VIREVAAPKAGYVSAMEGEALGLAVVNLGGGRLVESDQVDPAVGISDLVPLGAKVAKGQPLARIHASREDKGEAAAAAVLDAVKIAAKPPSLPQLIRERTE
jgi:thymidine phosphorylase